MTAINWKSGVSGDWSDTADWSTGAVPGASDSVTIAASGSYTVSITSAAAASSLTIGAAGAAVIDSAAFTLSTTLNVNAGAFSLASGGSVSAQSITTKATSILNVTG